MAQALFAAPCLGDVDPGADGAAVRQSPLVDHQHPAAALVFEVDGRVVLPFKLLCDPGVDILHRLGRYPGHGDRSYVSGEMDTGLGVGSDLRNQLEEAAVDMRQPILGVP